MFDIIEVGVLVLLIIATIEVLVVVKSTQVPVSC
jgi:hypothetical protein